MPQTIRNHWRAEALAEIINLNHVRKQAARARDKAQAEVNRLTFGRSKQERTTTQKVKADAVRHLDGHRLTPED